jgi:DNA-binding NarL/FixJ family response regulator
MAVLALVSDLMMQSQVSGAAQRAGVQLIIASSETQLVTKATDGAVELVIVDLSHPGIDPVRLMKGLKPLLAESSRTLAFGPHVHKALLEAAASAGFDAVMSRGQFHGNMESLLAGRF